MQPATLFHSDPKASPHTIAIHFLSFQRVADLVLEEDSSGTDIALPMDFHPVQNEKA
jgi:hypothetical protein